MIIKKRTIMKIKILLFLILLFPLVSWGQFGPEQSVDEIMMFYNSNVVATDIDGDNDLDIAATTSLDGMVWYENEDGLGTFGPVNTFPDGGRRILAKDIDGDGDMDLIYQSGFEIIWRENEDGLGNFGETQVVTMLNESGPQSIQIYFDFVDVDLDGDLDALVSSRQGLVWHENEDGLGAFGEKQEIANPGGGGSNISISGVDMDGDNDMDILLNTPVFDKIIWFENENGLGLFGPEKPVAITLDSVHVLHASDFDGDGDLDVLAASWSRVFWHENENGLGDFGVEQEIAINLSANSSINVGDLDNDGDIDILLTANGDEKAFWFENLNGLGNFGTQQVIADVMSSSRSIYPADFDGDGDLDVMYVVGGGGIVWHENFSEKPKLSGTCFWDENENGLLDNLEQGLKDQNIFLEPNALTSWTNSQGTFRFLLDAGTYDLTHQPNTNWVATSPSTVNVEIDNSGEEVIQNFGVKPVSEISQAAINLTSGPTRCGFTVPFWLTVTNTGTQIADGNITLELDPLVTYVEAFPAPISIVGNTLVWSINDLYPTYNEKVKLHLEMPGVDQLGEQIILNASTNIVDQDGSNPFGTTYDFESTINCAYDPNDKLVQPDIEGEENYTLFGETLQYTVRFQNTGTDTAFNIRIEDQLDEDLDWTSFKPLDGSHPFEVELSANGLVNFHFRDILLPDSTTNEVESHGFVKYEIRPKANLAENTTIENFAGIFFDFNPPIITNQTINTLVSMLPTSTADLDQKTKHVNVFPNPFSETTTIGVTDLDHPEQYTIHLLDIIGRQLATHSLTEGSIQLERGDLPAGVYFYQLFHDKEPQLLESGKIIIQ